MRLWVFLLALGSVAMASCAAAPASPPQPPTAQPAPYPDLGAAPELTNEVWLNTPQALRLADLRGQVVLLDMWTFG
jgi:hypothetical protein